MTLNQVHAMLRRECDKAGGQAAWAVAHAVSAAYVSDVLQGRREPGRKILDALGVERVVGYRKKGKRDGG